MRTFTGKNIDYKKRFVEVCIEDIAHSLALQNRFAGHTKNPYSVAQHSLLVSDFVSHENALWGLMHDSAEAYTMDVIRPLKTKYNEQLEEFFLELVSKKFGLCLPIPEEVKKVDNRILLTEMKSPEVYYHPNLKAIGVDECKPFDFMIIPMNYRQAERRFLEAFKDLTK